MICNSRHVERNEEFEIGARILSSLIRVSDLVGLPVVHSDIECEGIDAVIVGEPDVFQPGFLGVWEGVSHHVVGGNNLVAASPLGNYRNEITERLGMKRVWEIPNSNAYLVIEEWGQLQ